MKLKSIVYALSLSCVAAAVSSCNSGTCVTSSGLLSASLSIAPFAESDIAVYDTTTTTIGLLNGNAATFPVVVNLTDTNGEVALLSQSTCVLNSATDTCTVTLTGESAGTVGVLASANGYETVSSELLTVEAAGNHFVAFGNQGVGRLSGNAYSNIYNTNVKLNALALTSSNGGRFIAVGANGSVFSSSQSISAWATESSGIESDLNGVAVSSDGSFVAVGAKGAIIKLPSRSHIWSKKSSNVSYDLRSITVSANGEFVAVGESGVLTSADGESWSERTNSYAGLLSVAADTSNHVVAVGNNGVVISSSDNGVTWTSAVVPNNSYNSVVVTRNGEFFAVGQNGVILRSNDSGVTWTVVNTIGSTLRSIAINNRGEFIALNANNAIVKSMDNGLTWTTISGINASELNGIAKY